MLFFLTILLLILIGIIIMTQKCGAALFGEKNRKYIYRGVLYTDILMIVGLVWGYTVGHGTYAAGIVLHIAVMLFMGQLFFDFMTLVVMSVFEDGSGITDWCSRIVFVWWFD